MSWNRRRGKNGSKQFAKLDHVVLNTKAYADLTPVARALYVEIKKKYNGSNNGYIGFGVREAGEAIKRSRSTASRGFKELIEHGFIVVQTPSSFGQKRLTQEWYLTEYRNDRTSSLPSRDFKGWILGAGLQPAPAQKQNAVPSVKPTVPQAGTGQVKLPTKRIDSPAGGTAKPNPGPSQSHQWDTSISEPSGVKVSFGNPLSSFRRTAANSAARSIANATPPSTSNDNSVSHADIDQGNTDKIHAGSVEPELSSLHSDTTPPQKAQQGSQHATSDVVRSVDHNDGETENAETDPLVAAALRVFPGSRLIET